MPNTLRKIEQYLWENMRRDQILCRADNGDWVVLDEIDVYYEDDAHTTVGINLMYAKAEEVWIRKEDLKHD